MLENIILSDFERKQLDTLIASLEFKPNVLRHFMIALSLESRKVNFAKACEILMQTIKKYCQIKAQKYTIKGKHFSQYEEEYILTKFCFCKEFYNILPAWFVVLYWENEVSLEKKEW